MRDRLMGFLGSTIMVVVLVPQYTAIGSRKPLLAGYFPVNMSMAERDKSHIEARRIWEEALVAKGGRERLYGVHNIGISAYADYITHKGKRNRVRREYLYVFPNRYWFYEDYGSDVFGMVMHMYDYDSKMQYVGSPGSSETRLEPIRQLARNKRLDNAAIALLLETKWLQPVPLKAASEQIGLKKVDIVETMVDGRRVDFAFDQKAHLPVQVSFYNRVGDNTSIDIQHFSDYIEVDGIKVPQKLTYYEGTVEEAVIQFNVKFNEQLFVKPPTDVNPEAWRTETKK